jgi:hypothetical protein
MGKFQTHEDVISTATTTKAGCQPPRKGAAFAFPLYDQGLSGLVRRSGDWADVLPIFAATWARHDEHPPLKLWETRHPQQVQESAHRRKVNQTLRDCTHWCSPGPVPRFWTQALVRWLMLNPDGVAARQDVNGVELLGADIAPMPLPQPSPPTPPAGQVFKLEAGGACYQERSLVDEEGGASFSWRGQIYVKKCMVRCEHHGNCRSISMCQKTSQWSHVGCWGRRKVSTMEEASTTNQAARTSCKTYLRMNGSDAWCQALPVLLPQPTGKR